MNLPLLGALEAPLMLENIPALQDEVREQDGLLGREDRRGLGHEVHAAEGDDVAVGGRGLA